MRGVWRSQVTCTSMAAFLLANAPAGFALPSPHQKTTADDDVPACPISACSHCLHTPKSNTVRPGCAAHSAFRMGCADCAILSAGGFSAAKRPLNEIPSSCPTCPCPGGCSFCSVAKVPCSTLVTGTPLADLCPGERLSEVDTLLPSRFYGK